MIHRPSGRPGWGRLDWVNDGGRDEPLTKRDARLLVAWALGFLGVAVGAAALVTYLL